MKLARENITHEMQVEENLYRIRVFNHSNDRFIMTGYPAQRATLSRSLVDELMLRLALLEVIGLLLLGFFLGRKLFAPLGALKHGIEQIAAGRRANARANHRQSAHPRRSRPLPSQVSS